jgi:hypothetical protein
MPLALEGNEYICIPPFPLWSPSGAVTLVTHRQNGSEIEV